MITTVTAEPRNRRWSYQEYYRMAEIGFFREQRVELINGEIVEMAPQGNFHAMVIGLCREVLGQVFSRGFWIRERLPLRFGAADSEPEPDLSVVDGNPRDYSKGHPSSAVLIIEVCETTLEYDRGLKGNLYAASGIEDYWVVNLKERCVEQFRKPVADTGEPFGWKYADRQIFQPGDSVGLLAAPGALIPVADMLP